MNKGFIYKGITFIPVDNITSKEEKESIFTCIGKATYKLNIDYNYNEFYETAKESGKEFYKDLYTTENGGLFIPTNYALWDISEPMKEYGFYNFKNYVTV